MGVAVVEVAESEIDKSENLRRLAVSGLLVLAGDSEQGLPPRDVFFFLGAIPGVPSRVL